MNTPITITQAPVTRPTTHCVSDIAIPPLPRPMMPMQRGSDPYGLHRITEKTAAAFSITVDELMSDSRLERIVWPRQIAMYLAVKLNNKSTTTIGHFFGKNKRTVLHARDSVSDRIDVDKRAKAQVQAITETL
jgi:chromosomal replication initiator protein